MILKKHYLPFIFGAALTSCAVFIYPQRSFVLITLMLFLPLLDRDWQLITSQRYKHRFISLSLCVAGLLILTSFNTDYAVIILSTIFLTALPEEWFFRGYFMVQLEKMNLHPYKANILTSVVFSLLHLPTQGLFGLSVFIPSLIFGYVYQVSKSLILVILLHSLSNIIYIIYIQAYFKL